MDKIDMISVIMEYTELTQDGKAFMGDCPFCGTVNHFVCWPQKDMYKCFNCMEYGNTPKFAITMKRLLENQLIVNVVK